MTTAIRLDVAQALALRLVDSNLTVALRQLHDAKAQQVRVYAAVGLDPAKRYSISADGEVTENQTPPALLL